jgi:hypothetical protein
MSIIPLGQWHSMPRARGAYGEPAAVAMSSVMTMAVDAHSAAIQLRADYHQKSSGKKSNSSHSRPAFCAEHTQLLAFQVGQCEPNGALLGSQKMQVLNWLHRANFAVRLECARICYTILLVT